MPTTRYFTHGTTLQDGTMIVGRRINDLLISGRHRKKNSVYVEGGPFWCVHRIADYQAAYLYLHYDSGLPSIDTFDGYMVPSIVRLWTASHTSQVPSMPDYLDLRSDAWAAGATGYRKARPGNPYANVFQFEVEARDVVRPVGSSLAGFIRGGLVSQLRSAVGVFRALEVGGEEFLNYAFGWKPLLGDLRKMYNLQRRLDHQLSEIRRHNKKGIHRRREISDVKTTDTTYEVQTGFGGWWPAPSDAAQYMNIKSHAETVVQTVKHDWFSGKFTYYIPDTGDSRWTRKATAALFEGTPSPSTIWEVLPWSWLIDWFTNVGDVLSNASANAVDNLVSNYAYVMTTKVNSTTYTLTTEWPYITNLRFDPSRHEGATPGPQKLVGSYTIETTSKTRFDATPYGFGFTYSGLSDYQRSILAALGITRGHFSSTN